MKSIKLITLLVFYLTIQKVGATEIILPEGPVLKVEVTCKYVNLYSIKSDTAITAQRKIFPKGSILSVSGHDKNSKAKAIYITLNHEKEALYKDPIKLIAKGRHIVKIRALDKDNNETILSFSYLIVE